MSDPALQRVGTTIRNKWTLERLLGSGGMAAVYVGIHRIGRRDAIKILHPQAAQSKEICERFEREAHAANRFRHPGAVEIRDIDVTEDGAPFLVMELLEGESLADRVDRLGRIPLAELLAFAEQVLDTLRAAHAQGIIHRDIKPANLFALSEAAPASRTNAAATRIKVLDFGLARIHQDTSIQGELTRMGLVLGTTPYMPPEQAKGRSIDLRADLFAVGATMFRLIAGRHVHVAASSHDLLMKMARQPAPPLASVAPATPADVCLVVDRALAFDRDQRYPDADRMLEDVRAVLRGERPPHASRLHGDPEAVTVPNPNVGVRLDDGPPAPSTTIPVMVVADPLSADTESISVDWGEASISGDPHTLAGIGPASGEASISVDWSEEPNSAASTEPTPAADVDTTRVSPSPIGHRRAPR